MSQVERKKRGLSLAATITLITTGFVVAISAVLGVVLTFQSIEKMRDMVEGKALEMVKTAAALLDGDSLKGLEESDVGGPAYQKAYDTLKAFKITNEGSSGELAFIYGCRYIGNNQFEFTIDPSDDPAAFGEALDWTKALESAANGVAAFDQEPFTDRWGTFHSAYAPVFDSKGEVAMIVGVDIWANWYNAAIWSHSASIIIASAIAAASGVLVGVVINISIRRRFDLLSAEFNELEQDVQTLMSEIKEPMPAEKNSKGEGGDQVVKLRDQIQATQKEIKDYIIYTQKQAYVDGLARIGNRTAYLEKIKDIDLSEPFGIAVFDINGLKYINDHYGHEQGDAAIVAFSNVLKETFPEDSLFRIGGDEFVVLMFGNDQEKARQECEATKEKIKAVNETPSQPFQLNVSSGISFFDPSKDKEYKDAFRRADENMYAEKEEFYRRNPLLRKKYGH